MATVAKQCDKYISTITAINTLYEKHLGIAKDLARSASIVDIINILYQYPVVTAKQIADRTNIPFTSINRYLALLTEHPSI